MSTSTTIAATPPGRLISPVCSAAELLQLVLELRQRACLLEDRVNDLAFDLTLRGRPGDDAPTYQRCRGAIPARLWTS